MKVEDWKQVKLKYFFFLKLYILNMNREQKKNKKKTTVGNYKKIKN